MARRRDLLAKRNLKIIKNMDDLINKGMSIDLASRELEVKFRLSACTIRDIYYNYEFLEENENGN